jgi:Tol biopolymer transport system component
MRVTRSRSLAAFVGVILTILGCDTTEPPAPGAIRVVVTPAGEDIVLSGLRVSVVNGPIRPLNTGMLELTIFGLAPGVHTVQLEGLAANCQVAGANPRAVTVVSDQATTAEFNIVCAARVGSVRVTTATTGTDLDSDGYTAMVIGGPSQAIPVNGAATVANVREGQRMVTLGGVAPNCAITGADTATVTVQAGATSDVAFSIECVASGRLEVTVATTGVDPDPDGYAVDVQAASVGFARVLSVAPNASVTFPALRPAADYRVTLGGLAPNCDVVGTDVQTVAVTAGATTSVAFDIVCPPARLLAFVRDNDIYVISSSGTGATRLTTEPAFDGEPAWSSTGQIAFSTQRHSNDTELYVMSENGTSPTRITTSAGADDSPSWSPDGRKIVFRSLRDVNSEIYVANADGTGLTRLTNNAAADFHPAWSTTGQIAFVSDRDHASGEIYVMNADGSNVIRLTQNDSAEISPAWSPDGSMIAFSREVECYYGCAQDIFVMNADGSNARRLATGWATYEYHTDPSWSPNGRAIAFTRQYCGYYGCDVAAVWLVDLQGAQLSEITNNGANPAWKP